jgi:hypothetical protein
MNSPETTKYLVAGVASFMTVFLLLRIWFAWRSNARVAASMGGFTPTEASLARSQLVMLVVIVFGSMGLAIGAYFVPPVRDFLAAVGERGRWLRVVPIPFGALYLLWLRGKVRRGLRERAARTF